MENLPQKLKDKIRHSRDISLEYGEAITPYEYFIPVSVVLEYLEKSLDDYTKWLLDCGYCDDDVWQEKAVERYMKESSQTS